MIWDISFGLAFPPAAACGFGLLDRISGGRYRFFAGWAGAGLGGTASYLSDGRLWTALGCAASGLVALLAWWWRRRGRKRVAELLGAKSRALLAALVRKARDATRPRPVLGPVPGGARA